MKESSLPVVVKAQPVEWKETYSVRKQGVFAYGKQDNPKKVVCLFEKDLARERQGWEEREKVLIALKEKAEKENKELKAGKLVRPTPLHSHWRVSPKSDLNDHIIELNEFILELLEEKKVLKQKIKEVISELEKVKGEPTQDLTDAKIDALEWVFEE